MHPAGASDGGNALTAQVFTGASSAKASGPALTGGTPETDEALLHFILSSLDQDGAEEVVTIDLRGKSPVADHMIVASGRSTRHVAAICEHLMERLKAETGKPVRAEGLQTADWILLDAGDVIVHVFRPEVRDFYQIEKMWMAEPDRTARAL